MSMPIYRAKKIDSDEWVEGYLSYDREYEVNRIVVVHKSGKFKTSVHSFDPSTLAIHFDGMVDKDGKKIFAGLSEDGKGGDVLNCRGKDYYARMHQTGIIEIVDNEKVCSVLLHYAEQLEIIGVRG